MPIPGIWTVLLLLLAAVEVGFFSRGIIPMPGMYMAEHLDDSVVRQGMMVRDENEDSVLDNKKRSWIVSRGRGRD